jgi:neurofibromin 1
MEMQNFRPQIELLYNKSSDLRAMFIETLNRVTQGYTMHTPLKMIPSITLKEKVINLKGKKSYFYLCMTMFLD